MSHEDEIKKYCPLLRSGNLKSRESNTVEFKEAFNKNSTAKYAKTMAAYANNREAILYSALKTIRARLWAKERQL